MTLDSVQTRVDGDQVTLNCYLQPGFVAEDLHVSVEGDDVVIKAEHNKVVNGTREERSCTRRIGLPEGVIQSSINCNYDERTGHLTIKARRHEPPPLRKLSPSPLFLRREVNIPIRFK